MRWKFHLIGKSSRFIRYSYARESDNLDGVIQYDTLKDIITIITPCDKDKSSLKAQEWTISHFEKVVAADFPDDLSVCCG